MEFFRSEDFHYHITPRQAAMQIAKAVQELNKASAKVNKTAITKQLKLSYPALSYKSNWRKGLQLLVDHRVIEKLPVLGWRLMRPMEDVVSELAKWSAPRPDKPSPVTITRPKNIDMQEQQHKADDSSCLIPAIKDAKSISIQVNNVTITIGF